MFFRRETPHHWTFDERLSSLNKLGFETVSDGPGQSKVIRGGCAAVVETLGEGNVRVGKAGILIGPEIGLLVNRGYQMFLLTPSGKEVPAQAGQLKVLHAFDEDLREGLGLTSLYNLSLGTVSDEHLYDRVTDRDRPKASLPWEK